MEDQQEIGGAQALLQLGTKSKDEEEDHDQVLNISHDLQDEEDLSDSKTTNQQINDAVEAAVMRYVGGTLDSNTSTKKQKRKLNHDDIMNNINDFNQWTGFLDDNIDDHPEYFQEQRKKKKKKRRSGSNSQLDPDLTGLGSNEDRMGSEHRIGPDRLGTSEHDQLVEAAIIDARELARHINDEELQDNASVELSLSNVPPDQAQQVIAAATAAVQNLGHSAESISAITQLAQAASSLSSSLKRGKPTPKSKKMLKRIENSLIHYATTSHHTDDHSKQGTSKPDFNNLTNVESLVEESSEIACNWYNSLPNNTGKGPRIFSDQEIQAVDHFIAGYCHLNKWSREDICNRIWSNVRKKDKFWENLTRVLPYRSRASVYKHVRRQYHVFDVRAKWTKQDDELLRRWGTTHEGKWKQIGEAMGRMPEDCRDRWRNYVKCGENRSSNKWSVEEENTLTDIVTQMLHDIADKEKEASINWTVVSERMNGVRSRIQCRYKWSKLLKRESVLKSSFMDPQTKLWLVQKLQQSNYDSFEAIDWKFIAHMYHDEFTKVDYSWSEGDFKYVFEKMKSDIKDHRKLPMAVVYDRITDGLYKNQSNAIADEEQLLLGHTAEQFQQQLEEQNKRASTTVHESKEHMDPNDPTSIANAAVAAVSSAVDADDVQQQEYSLWR